jgi:hypothetical protein
MEILLDRDGTAPVLEGYKLVTTELEFLQLATGAQSLLIRGNAMLCDWAEAFCNGRHITCRETISPPAELMAICADLTATTALQIYEQLGEKKFYDLERPLQTRDILTAVYLESLWHNEAGISHAAQWLLWFIEEKPSDAIQPLLFQLAKQWQLQVDVDISSAYAVRTAEQSLEIIENWLGLRSSLTQHLPPFPIPILPTWLKAHAEDIFNKCLIDSKGAFILEAAKRTWPPDLRRALAKPAYRYFKQHPADLSFESWRALRPFLERQERNEFQGLLPPQPPKPVPQAPETVLTWFKQEYLPYRNWQLTHQIEAARPIIQERAREFAFWYLENYPRALSGGALRTFLSFERALAISRDNLQSIVLVVVADGLHVADAEELLRHVRELTSRLSVGSDLAFAALPTITQFCKEALFRGVPPVHTSQVEPLGKVLKEQVLPVSILQEAKTGEIYLWRVLEPDHTYHHRNLYETLAHDIDSQLQAIARNIAFIVEQVPAHLPLEIILTSDHGRLLALSERTLPIPLGMESHGRAAWGKIQRQYSSNGYEIQGQVVFCDADHFGMTEAFAVPLDEKAFLTNDNKSGKEWFAHGGLYPEEVIVPWIVLARDCIPPKVEIRITGRANAGQRGKLIVTLLNLGDIDLTLNDLSLAFGPESQIIGNLDLIAPSRSSKEYPIDFLIWPSTKQAEQAKSMCHIKQPNALVFDVPAEVTIQSDEMYQSDNILEDLV